MRIRWALLAIGLTGLIAAIGPASASAMTEIFSNTTPVVGPSGALDVGKASPSPSTITVSGMTGVVTDVNVFFDGLDATSVSDDIDALLQAPFGQTTMLMSDAGGSNADSNLNVQFTDQAGAEMPDSTPIASQAYKPTDYGTSLSDAPGLDPMLNVEAPPPPYGLTLSLSDGTDPNGSWNLYVDDDDNDLSTVQIANGWRIEITTTDVPPPANTTTGNPTTPGATVTPPKKCKKGKKLKHGRCVKKKHKK